MGYKLWDPEARKIVHSNDVFFNEDKMHEKPVKTVEIRRVIFEEDGHVHRGVQNAGQVGQNSPMYKRKLEEMNRPLRLNLLSDGPVELVEHLIGIFLL